MEKYFGAAAVMEFINQFSSPDLIKAIGGAVRKRFMLRRLPVKQAWDEMVMNGQNGKKKVRVVLCTVRDVTKGPKPLVPPPETP